MYPAKEIPLRTVLALFRKACGENPSTTWRHPKNVRPLKCSCSSRKTINPDQVIAFDVKGSVRRVVMFCFDSGELPLQQENGESLFSRTVALAKSRNALVSRKASWAELLPAKVCVNWIKHDSSRLDELRNLCSAMNLLDIYFIDRETFFRAGNVLSLKWQQANDEPHTLI